MEDQNNKIDEKRDFFRFYKDGAYEKEEDLETKSMYEKIFWAMANIDGILPEAFKGNDAKETYEKIVKKCKEIDDTVQKSSNKIKEGNIGLQGFFKFLRENDTNNTLNLPEPDEKGDIHWEKLGNAVLIKYREQHENELNRIDDMLKNKPKDETSLENWKKEMANYQSTIEGLSFLGQLAAGPYFPRTTMASASHYMGKGSVMEIGCSQGKTSVVAKTTYDMLMQGKKVFSTSSNPGLVPENYDEAKAFYEKMGVTDQFVAISQNAKDNTDHIVVFLPKGKDGKTTKYEIRADGKIIAFDIGEKNNPRNCDKLQIEAIVKMMELPTRDDGTYDFEKSVRKMIQDKGIIMGDTITLQKYQHLFPERDEDGVIPETYLIVDEADGELLDTQPQEILGKEYDTKVAKERWENRKKANKAMEKFDFDGSTAELSDTLERIAKEEGIPLDFIVDAYEAKTAILSKTDEKLSLEDEPKIKISQDGRVFVMNPNTNVFVPASQGLAEAILADKFEKRSDAKATIKTEKETSEEKTTELTEFNIQLEKEVLRESTIAELFKNFSMVSLMSGTMQDKGVIIDEEYTKRRSEFLSKFGNAVDDSMMNGVVKWKLVTPKTREEKGNVVVNLPENDKDIGIDRDDAGNIHTRKNSEEKKITDWKKYIENNREKLEQEWKKAVTEEAEYRASKGQPVMVSTYGDKRPLEGVPYYSDKNQIQQKYGDDTYLKTKDGIGEIACFDDFYGRGYTFKFYETDKNGKVITHKENEKEKPNKVDKGGHVLITTLPQNSRNLEQFLFRVARGGDKGSSSIIINPCDPTLEKYLEKLQDEDNKKGTNKANEYFQNVLNGNISIDQMVADIYPEETKLLFQKKQKELEFAFDAKTVENYNLENISAISEKRCSKKF